MLNKVEWINKFSQETFMKQLALPSSKERMLETQIGALQFSEGDTSDKDLE